MEIFLQYAGSSQENFGLIGPFIVSKDLKTLHDTSFVTSDYLTSLIPGGNFSRESMEGYNIDIKYSLNLDMPIVIYYYFRDIDTPIVNNCYAIIDGVKTNNRVSTARNI